MGVLLEHLSESDKIRSVCPQPIRESQVAAVWEQGAAENILVQEIGDKG
jgi:hypothetical protein